MKLFVFVSLLVASFLSLSCAAQPSYYYSKQGQKVLGHIVFHPSQLLSKSGVKTGYISFREADRSKEAKLSIEQFSAFVIGIDSFAVINHLRLQQHQTRPVADIVQVLEKGKMNLYLHRTSQKGGNKLNIVETYVLALAGSATSLCLYTFDTQQEELATLFEAEPRLQGLIRSGKVRVESIPNLVRAYNSSNKAAYHSKSSKREN